MPGKRQRHRKWRQTQENEDYTSSKERQTVSAPKKECDVCTQIILAFRHDFKIGYTPQFSLGTWDNLCYSPCTSHAGLLKALFPEEYLYNSLGHVILRRDHAQSPIYLNHKPLLLLTSHSGLGVAATGRTVHPKWINVNLLEQWKSECSKNHKQGCVNPRLDVLGDIRPTWLIDVWCQSLVSASVSGTYVALSYVWGTLKFFTTTKGNIESLQYQGALSKVALPDTIRDAIGCTKRLGERYLWVDSICILHDDTAGKYIEMEKMAAIYANATVTIIAAGGSDAFSGLRGLREVSSLRNHQQKTFDAGLGAKLSITIPNPYSFEMTTWSRRAWTFQEEMFSKRRLVFQAQTVRWQCQRAICYEDTISEVASEWNHVKSLELSSHFPDPSLYKSLVDAYNIRDLTYPEDALNAFAGIMRILGGSYKSGFISGLPQLCFSIALLWQPKNIAERRTAKVASGTRNCLPSWSWAGWKCEVSGPIDTWLGETITPHHANIQPQSAVQWYRHQDPDVEGTRVVEELKEYRHRYMGTSASAPTGWTKHNTHFSLIDGGPKLFERSPAWPDWFLPSSRAPASYYKHESDSKVEFWFPIPLPDSTKTPVSIVSAPLISCRTRRAWVTGGKLQQEEYTKLYSLLLSDGNGDSTGSITPLLFQSLGPTPKDGDEQQDCEFETKYLGRPIELVEVATGRERNMDHDVRTGKFHDVLKYGVDYFYYAMWIVWDGKVAYRKGLGKIDKAIWEAQDREWIDLMLG
ncbi:hypothetical protein VTL71DRAFT_2951 [Oculimacula yallundae]|uniref:Heterokaryon incompatibility domain-containing protein n=1 Tax=Oculimacula yallundae TaxID=86028 RepID=A0ABR4C6Z6_9HELO